MIDFSQIEGLQEQKQLLQAIQTENSFERLVREVKSGKHDAQLQAIGMKYNAHPQENDS